MLISADLVSLTFISSINFTLNWVEYENSFITSGPGNVTDHRPIQCKKQVSMTRKYHNYRPQTKPMQKDSKFDQEMSQLQITDQTNAKKK